MLSQFTSEGSKKCLADLDFNFPKDVYPVGRLDELSEGLLLLTNDKRVNDALLNPKHAHTRVYQVCVAGEVSNDALLQLTKGVEIKAKKSKHFVQAASARKIPDPGYPERNVSFSYSKEKGLSWCELTLTTGKNRQVRKMTAAVGFPTLRLVRTRIEKISLDQMKPGDVVEIQRDEFMNLTAIKLK